MGEELRALVEQVRWREDGLVPVVTRDWATGDVLMLAYMNRAALERTLQSGQAVYFSRSRQQLWVKGESSGNRQKVRRVWLDCDGDALLLEVEQEGVGACHTGRWSCFHRPLAGSEDGEEPVRAGILDRLARRIDERRRQPQRGSYTARLLGAAPDAPLKKLAEEAGEVLLAAKGVELALEAHGTPQALERSRAALAWEAADLLYHLMVALAWAGVPAEAVWAELARRWQAPGRAAASGQGEGGQELR